MNASRGERVTRVGRVGTRECQCAGRLCRSVTVQVTMQVGRLLVVDDANMMHLNIPLMHSTVYVLSVAGGGEPSITWRGCRQEASCSRFGCQAVMYTNLGSHVLALVPPHDPHWPAH